MSTARKHCNASRLYCNRDDAACVRAREMLAFTLTRCCSQYSIPAKLIAETERLSFVHTHSRDACNIGRAPVVALHRTVHAALQPTALQPAASRRQYSMYRLILKSSRSSKAGTDTLTRCCSPARAHAGAFSLPCPVQSGIREPHCRTVV